MNRRVRILNGMFDALTLPQTVDRVFDVLRSGSRGWLCTVNVATLMAMRRDAPLQAFVDSACIVVADGQPLVWCAPLFDGRLPERVAGIDLIDALCARAVAEDAGMYLLGSTGPWLEKALATLRSRHPTLRLDGADGYFCAQAERSRVESIRASGARILLVGMGSPLQEAFIRRHWERLGVAMAIGVGGSFDVLAGARFRAPAWMRRAGLEWLVRLAQEPRRLLPRYLATNWMFCGLIADTVVARAKRWLGTT